MMSKLHYAIAAMAFALFALVVLAVFGGPKIQGLAVFSAILISWSQFAAQSPAKIAGKASIIAVYLALLLTLIAAMRLFLGLP